MDLSVLRRPADAARGRELAVVCIYDLCVRACVRACVYLCVCMRACMRACVCARACARARTLCDCLRACGACVRAFVRESGLRAEPSKSAWGRRWRRGGRGGPKRSGY